MRHLNPLFAAAAILLLALTSHASEEKPNFLFIAIDDLNDFAGFSSEEPGNFLQIVYPDPKVRKKVVERLTPNLNRLAEYSAPFVRSYCASALCGPSRTSLMTGVAPHVSGYYLHSRHFRTYDTLKDVVTLPQHLRENGYFTTGAGKIFHKAIGNANGPLENDWSDAKYSWNVWVNHGQGAGGKPGKYAPPEGGNMQFGRGTQLKEETGDWKTADFIATILEKGSAQVDERRTDIGPDTITLPENQPFFLAGGIFRPHLPFYAPPEFFDLFPVNEMSGLNRESLNDILNDLTDLPKGAERFTDLSKKGKFYHVMAHARSVGGAEGEIEGWRAMVQAYLACVAFADDCLGRIIEGYENSPHRNNTVLVMWSDHGYHLGPKYHVAKQAVWEKANRTLLLFYDPRQQDQTAGVLRRQLASLNDLYPTISEYAGLETPDHVVGKSLLPVIENANAPATREEFVFTYMQGNHCLRTEDYAYIRYKDGSQELYDMHADPRQLINLAINPENDELLKSLNTRLENWLKNPF